MGEIARARASDVGGTLNLSPANRMLCIHCTGGCHISPELSLGTASSQQPAARKRIQVDAGCPSAANGGACPSLIEEAAHAAPCPGQTSRATACHASHRTCDPHQLKDALGRGSECAACTCIHRRRVGQADCPEMVTV